MSSLQDQLLKAGLIDGKKAKQASKAKRKAKKVQHKSNTIAVDETKEAVAKANAEKLERDRKLNEELKAEADRKAINAQIKQLIEMNAQPKEGGRDEVAYNFTDGKKIAKVYVSPRIQQQLSLGRLAIVKINDSYELVPAIIADKISQRDEAVVLSQNTADETLDDEDPYADYEIPDDLMW